MSLAVEDHLEIAEGELTVADLVDRFGPIPIRRILLSPSPGTATEEDVVDLDDHEDRLCELIDGILVEKTVGFYESYLTVAIIALLSNYVREHKLGIVLGTDGMILLSPGLVRIPDVSFISWNRLPGHKVPRDPICTVIPDLAVEVLSRGNTKKEMDRKLTDYFTAGVRQVWYVYPKKREIQVFHSLQEFQTLTDKQTLEGGDVLPGFSVEVKSFFPE
ncbi:MAG: Uma2 family endonuclease [Pirellulales bacterium]|nr:Uma2 family endonuclease [Pirellulales bacterium]